MRLVFGVVSLLIVVAITLSLVREQLGARSPVGRSPASAAVVSLPMSAPQRQSEQLQDQVKQSLDAAMQPTRAEADDK